MAAREFAEWWRQHLKATEERHTGARWKTRLTAFSVQLLRKSTIRKIGAGQSGGQWPVAIDVT